MLNVRKAPPSSRALSARGAVTIPVLFVLPQNALMLDLAGPAEVLRLASQLVDADAAAAAFGQADAPRFELLYASPLQTVQTSIGLPLAGLSPLPEVLPPGAMVVLVGCGSTADPVLRAGIEQSCAAIAAWLRRLRLDGDGGHRLLSVCSGALIAARAGLLDGRQCTTHHALCDELQALAPLAKVLANRLYVSDGHISTSAGITAGIDMMLQVLAELCGARAASAVARNMVVYMRRTGADPQLSAWLTGRNHLHPALHRVQDALAADPARDWSAADMARIACASTRHLGRLFLEHTGGSPLDHVHRLRVAMARDLLMQSALDMERVAQHAGFHSARHLRRIWGKYHGHPPSEVRAGA
jgi:transcriptional regulator GlxA family with amidase domain